MVIFERNKMSYPWALRLEKAATDAGFDLSLSEEYLIFSSTDSTEKISIGMDSGKIVLLLSEYSKSANVKLHQYDLIAIPPEISQHSLSTAYISDNLQTFFDALCAVYVTFRIRIENKDKISHTEKEYLIEIRTKQGEFRSKILEFWNGECALTGLSNPLLLRASHIKPWAESNNEERLDVYNGFLLNVMADAAFDRGLISFDDDGMIIFSDAFDSKSRKLSNISKSACIKIDKGHRGYLEYHRKFVFNRL